LLKNTAEEGDAVYYFYRYSQPFKKRDTTVTANEALSSDSESGWD
jgi:hypothetical protein